MIHAFLAGFTGAIGVLCAFWCWNRMAAWQDGKAARQEQRRLIAAEREQQRRIEQQEREQQRVARQKQRRRARTQQCDWPTNAFGWLQVSLSVVFYLALVGGVVAAFTG